MKHSFFQYSIKSSTFPKYQFLAMAESILRLPAEIQEHIYSSSPRRDLCNLACSSSAFNASIVLKQAIWKQVTFKADENSPLKLAHVIRNSEYVQHLDLRLFSGTPFEDNDFLMLFCCLAKLKTLKVDFSHCPDHGFTSIGFWDSYLLFDLVEIHLIRCPVNALRLSRCSKIRKIVIEDADLIGACTLIDIVEDNDWDENDRFFQSLCHRKDLSKEILQKPKPQLPTGEVPLNYLVEIKLVNSKFWMNYTNSTTKSFVGDEKNLTNLKVITLEGLMDWNWEITIGGQIKLDLLNLQSYLPELDVFFV